MDLIKDIFPDHIKNEYIQYLKKEEYESYYSTKNKYPYIIIERLSMNTGNPADGYEKIKRSEVEDPFKPDPEIKSEYSFTNSDYTLMMSYGLSPGHNAPAGHHHTRPDIWESTFLYSNITPQEMTFNSGLWVILENWCKLTSKKQSGLNFTNFRVITGSIPDKKNTLLKFGEKLLNVNIPTHMFKIVIARSKKPEHKNKLFIGCFLYPNRPLDPLRESNLELHNWLIPLPKLEELSGFKFESIFKKYYDYDTRTFEFLNINELVPVKFKLNPSFNIQMVKSKWFSIIIYSSDLKTLDRNLELLKKDPILKDEDLKYHIDFYNLVKDRMNANNVSNINNNITPLEITPLTSSNNNKPLSESVKSDGIANNENNNDDNNNDENNNDENNIVGGGKKKINKTQKKIKRIKRKYKYDITQKQKINKLNK